MSCSTLAARGELTEAGGARAAGAAHAGRSAVAGARREFRRPVAVAAQHPAASSRTRACFRSSTRTCARRSSARPSCSSRASCARIAACSELLTADYTFVNERLARHYGIPNVYGSHFRRVTLTDDARRGLLGKGSILTVTSYPNRTSPVLRGKWLLENMLGAPPPPPPPDVPALQENGEDGAPRCRCASGWSSTATNPVCASCHSVMDPLGFALENFDAIGKWRADAKRDGRSTPPARCPTAPSSTARRRCATRCCARREEFVAHRHREAADLCARPRRSSTTTRRRSVRCVSDAAADDYRWSSLILGIVKSTPFQMRVDAEQSPRNRGRGCHDAHHQDVAARRTFLRGLGATLALPLLDSMVPALRPLRAAAGTGRAGWRRLRAERHVRWRTGRRRPTGASFELTPTLEPLAPFRDRLLVVTGLTNRPAFPPTARAPAITCAPRRRS